MLQPPTPTPTLSKEEYEGQRQSEAGLCRILMRGKKVTHKHTVPAPQNVRRTGATNENV